jgi:hypothetical protein
MMSKEAPRHVITFTSNSSSLDPNIFLITPSFLMFRMNDGLLRFLN